MIRSGTKTLELRVAFPSFAKLKKDDTVAFSNSKDETVLVKITRIHLYSSIKEVKENENVSKLAPGMTDNQLEQSAQRIFDPTEIDQYGLMLIEFEKVNQK